jgi:hypothetical protein
MRETGKIGAADETETGIMVANKLQHLEKILLSESLSSSFLACH